MPALVSGYESSDDEQPIATTSKSIKPDPAPVEDDEDDEKLEEQAKVDAFGLSNLAASRASSDDVRKNGLQVMAAPDVLKEVRVMIEGSS